MTASEKKARRAFYRKRYCLNGPVVAGLLIFFLCSMIFLSIMVSARSEKDEAAGYKYYTSVEITKGDTLWSIAKEYCPEQVPIRNYVKEISKMNGIVEDEIYAGSYLTVYYYSGEYK